MAEEEKKKKKIGKIIVDCILGGLILLIIGLLVNAMATKKENYGIPSVFGRSYMYVLTDSMEGDNADSFDAGEGIVIQKKKVDEVKVDDVITFYSPTLEVCVSHRIQEIVYSPKIEGDAGSFIVSANNEYSLDNVNWTKGGELVSLESGKTFRVRRIAKEGSPVEPSVPHLIPSYKEEQKIMFYTCGDNLEADWYKEKTGHAVSSNYRDDVDSQYYIGTVVSHSKGLGFVLGTVQEPWFIPAVIMLPIVIIAALSIVDFVKEWKKETAKEEAAFQEALDASGIDKTDEAAVAVYREKYQYRLDMKKELETIKKEQKEAYLKEMRKAKEQLKKDNELARIKEEEEKQKILEEMKEEQKEEDKQ